jgi:ferredoxin/coenzyme F420-reducing hydrogenase delta subunit
MGATGAATKDAIGALERLCDAPFGPAANPLRQLGALAFLCFWLAIASGIYVYAFFETSVAGAYDSLQSLAENQPYAGGAMRSLHRYASDALIALVALHLVREWALGRYSSFRWFSWLSGVPLVWLVIASGMVGYWLVWDELAQYVATALMEWIAVLPGFDAAMVRNAVAAENVSDRLFSLLMFAHIALSLLLLLGMWVHLQRLARPRSRPQTSLGWGAAVALLVLALAVPAMSQGRADLAAAPQTLGFDWFYLFVLPASQLASPALAWAAVLAGTIALAMLPWLGRTKRPPPARVDPAHCNGCGRCFEDCPYQAITLEPRQRAAAGAVAGNIAVVHADACAACGICAGACPSSTPFRSIDTLRSGIDLPQLTVAELRSRLERKLAALEGEATAVVFGCEHGPSAGALAAPGVATMDLPCLAMLPPSFIEYALRGGAHGVLLAGCGAGDCQFRLGEQWTRARLAAEREPHLRASVPRERVHAVWLHRSREQRLANELDALRARLAGMTRQPAAPPLRLQGTRHG